MASVLILLLLGLSFNAYACVLPLFGSSAQTMESGCTSPEDQPTRQFCDTFKTLGADASPKPLSSGVFVHLFILDSFSWVSLCGSALPTGGAFDPPLKYPHQQQLLKTTVLRI
ncbi:MAG: hypothetical protein ACRERU_02230 [Methylococcales bacterium]